MAEGAFREDLYYRLNVVPLCLPPLRERAGDVPLLVEHVLARAARRFGRPAPAIPPDVMAACERYGWPGNVRELANVVERAVILSDGPALRLDEPLGAARPPTTQACGTTMEEVERSHVLKVLAATGWQVRGTGGAAEVLGLHPSTLRSRMKKLGLERPKPTA